MIQIETTNEPKKRYNLELEHLSAIPVFDRLDPEELKELLNFMNCIGYNEGDVIAKEGEAGEHVYFILQGKMDVVKQGYNGPAIISTIGKGKSIGEMAIIDDYPRSASLIANTEIILLSLTREGFDEIMEHHPYTGVKILKGVARLLSMNLRKTAGRLADYMTPMA